MIRNNPILLEVKTFYEINARLYRSFLDDRMEKPIWFLSRGVFQSKFIIYH